MTSHEFDVLLFWDTVYIVAAFIITVYELLFMAWAMFVPETCSVGKRLASASKQNRSADTVWQAACEQQ